jgi:hypothetical protein
MEITLSLRGRGNETGAIMGTRYIETNYDNKTFILEKLKLGRQAASLGHLRAIRVTSGTLSRR